MPCSRTPSMTSETRLKEKFVRNRFGSSSLRADPPVPPRRTRTVTARRSTLRSSLPT